EARLSVVDQEDRGLALEDDARRLHVELGRGVRPHAGGLDAREHVVERELPLLAGQDLAEPRAHLLEPRGRNARNLDARDADRDERDLPGLALDVDVGLEPDGPVGGLAALPGVEGDRALALQLVALETLGLRGVDRERRFPELDLAGPGAR